MPPRKKSVKNTATEVAPVVEAPVEVIAPIVDVVEVTSKKKSVKNTVTDSTVVAAVDTIEPVVGKKKIKKPIQIVALVTPEGIEGTFQPVEQRRSLIAHLQIHSNEVNFNETNFQYDPNPPKQPEPYDLSVQDLAPFEYETAIQVAEAAKDLGKPVPIADPLGNPQHASAKADLSETAPLQPFYRCNLMVSYRDTNETQLLPESVDISCFWCTEPFEGQPCVIPEREDKGTYKIYGNFCCPECGLAFLLNESLDPHVRWERIALLHRLYSKWYTNRIFPAPARESLKKFGGPMMVEQFRATLHSASVRVDIQMPPLVSILGTMDTKPIDFYDTSVRNSANGVVTERITRAEEGLRLRRNKPLKDKDSTLDSCMKISIKSRQLGVEGQI
jgi:hypothetical protein